MYLKLDDNQEEEQMLKETDGISETSTKMVLIVKPLLLPTDLQVQVFY